MPNTSASGGYLAPTSGPISSQALQRFLHDVVTGITGLDPKLVRPRWQQNPPPTPAIDTDWLGFGIVDVRPDDNSYVAEKADGLSAVAARHEELDLLCSFYGPECLNNAALLRDGFQISQNREQLFLAAMGFVGSSDTSHVPELVNGRYFERADITITLRREVRREYPVLIFVAATGFVKSETLTVNWSA